MPAECQSALALSSRNLWDDLTVVRTKRRTMAITVLPTGKIELRVPEITSSDLVWEKLHKRRRWILRQQRYFAKLGTMPSKRRYVSGESHRYLGRSYRLKVSQSNIDKVKLLGGYFRISTTNKDPAHVQRVFNQWLKGKAIVYFRKRASLAAERLKVAKFDVGKILIKRMEYRWGSCTSKGSIYLTPDLIQASSMCVDYVITHELIHLWIPNHSKRFYSALDKFLPNWRLIKTRLESEQFEGLEFRKTQKEK